MTDHRTKWLAVLAALVNPLDPARAATAMGAYLPFLAKLPDAAFCLRSAEAVAMAPRRVSIPSYDELANPLFGYWRDHRPDRHEIAQAGIKALPAPVRAAGPTDAEIEAVQATVQQFVQAVRAKGIAQRVEVKPAYLTGEALKRFRQQGAVQ